MFGKTGATPASLVGKWMGRVNDEPVGMEFLPDGRLAYVVLSGGKTQIMRMTYRVDGDVLVTNQLSAPHEARSPFRIDGDGLTISFEGTQSMFQRDR